MSFKGQLSSWYDASVSIEDRKVLIRVATIVKILALNLKNKFYRFYKIDFFVETLVLDWLFSS